MWSDLFGKTRKEWQDMGFSKASIKFLMECQKQTFDKNIISFMQKCEVNDPMRLAFNFCKIYMTFDRFLNSIQGKT